MTTEWKEKMKHVQVKIFLVWRKGDKLKWIKKQKTVDTSCVILKSRHDSREIIRHWPVEILVFCVCVVYKLVSFIMLILYKIQRHTKTCFSCAYRIHFWSKRFLSIWTTTNCRKIQELHRVCLQMNGTYIVYWRWKKIYKYKPQDYEKTV